MRGGAVYEAVRKLESGGLIASVPHAIPLIAPTRRYCLTAAGLHRLAREEGMTVDEMLARCPVSEQGRRILMERLDAAVVVYRLATALSNVAFPIRFRWYRAMPMDVAVTLPDGRTVAVGRQGLTASRTVFSKRLWRLREEFRPSAFLLLMPDEVRLRHARRLMAGTPSIAFLALERDVAFAGANAPIWRPPSGPDLFDLRTALIEREAARRMKSPAGSCPPCSSPPRREPSSCSRTGRGSRPPTLESCWESSDQCSPASSCGSRGGDSLPTSTSRAADDWRPPTGG